MKQKVDRRTDPGQSITSLNIQGHEIPDPEPLVLPSGFRRPETLAEQVQRLVRTGLSRMAEEQGMESFEEAEDFDVDEDEDPSTPYETFFDPVLGKDLSPQEFRDHEQAYRRQYLEAQRRYYQFQDRQRVLERGADPAGPKAPQGRQPEHEAPGGSQSGPASPGKG